MTTTELFGLLQKIGESTEGGSRNNASIAFFSALSKTVEGIDSAKAESEFRQINHYYSDSRIYTPAFKRYINSATDVFQSNQSDSSKYVSIGRIFAGFRCGHKNYSERLKTHVLNLYRIRLYNKEIMLDKLTKMMTIIKNKIGACDIGFEQHMIKSPGRQVNRLMSKASATVKSIKSAADNFLFTEDSQISDKMIESIETVRDGAVNLARYESIALCKMLNQKIVSAAEFNIEKKNNGLFWLTNPGILTALTTMNSVAITTSGAAAKLGATENIKHMSNILHIAAAGLASAALLPVAPVASFVAAYAASKLSKTEIVQYFNANSRLREEFHSAINDISGSKEECSFWTDKEGYVSRHTKVGNLIKEYNEICAKEYDTIINLCDYFQNAYHIICSDPILLGLDELSLSNKPTKSLRNTRQKTRQKTRTSAINKSTRKAITVQPKKLFKSLYRKK